ncbi:hypothetical protein E2C01_089660 [Portunus trituberculatus]|uniref:Uncharacterized protein n=1 Tax=Portunus trituberculatus TaxID=210409 RepID=A0A5B7JI24_PORTR|nr:hypothetical protein [Portunus trituberculatus]
MKEEELRELFRGDNEKVSVKWKERKKAKRGTWNERGRHDGPLVMEEERQTSFLKWRKEGRKEGEEGLGVFAREEKQEANKQKRW